MPPLFLVALGLAVLGAALLVGGFAWMRLIGADPRTARRLAGARPLAVADVLDLEAAPERPIRLSGRIRCSDPLVAPDDERLVAFHRDVAVRMPDGRWRTIERIRAGRSFELWDHAGSLVLDPAEAAEPLITIPLVWEGRPDELEEPHASAVARLAAEEGPPTAARAVTRTISVVDSLLVLADVRLDPEGPTLAPPPGGYLVSALELDAAMRLLGGARRGQLRLAIGALGAGVVVLVAAAAAAVVGQLIGS